MLAQTQQMLQLVQAQQAQQAQESQQAQNAPNVQPPPQETHQVQQQPPQSEQQPDSSAMAVTVESSDIKSCAVITVEKSAEGLGCTDIKLNFNDPAEPLAVVNIKGPKEGEKDSKEESEQKEGEADKGKRKVKLKRRGRSRDRRRSRAGSRVYGGEDSDDSNDSGFDSEVSRLAENLYHSKLCRHSSTHAIADGSDGRCCSEASDAECQCHDHTSRSKQKRRGRTMRRESHCSTVRCSSCGNRAHVFSDLQDDGHGNREARVRSVHRHGKEHGHKSNEESRSGSPEEGHSNLPALPASEGSPGGEGPQTNVDNNFGNGFSGQSSAFFPNGPNAYSDGPAIYTSVPSPVDRRVRFGEPIYVDADGIPFTYTRQRVPPPVPHGAQQEYLPYYDYPHIPQPYVARYRDGTPMPVSQDIPPHPHTPYLPPHRNYSPHGPPVYPIPPPHWHMPQPYHNSNQVPKDQFTGNYRQRYGTRKGSRNPSDQSRSHSRDVKSERGQNSNENWGSSQWDANGNQSSGWDNGTDANEDNSGGNGSSGCNAWGDNDKGNGDDDNVGSSGANDAWGDNPGKGARNNNWGWATNNSNNDGDKSGDQGVDNPEVWYSNTDANNNSANDNNGNSSSDQWNNWDSGNDNTGDSWTCGNGNAGNSWGNDEARNTQGTGNRNGDAWRSSDGNTNNKPGKKKVSWGENSETIVNQDGGSYSADDAGNIDSWGDSGGTWGDDTNDDHGNNDTNNNSSWGVNWNDDSGNNWSNSGAADDAWGKSSDGGGGGGYKDPWIGLDNDADGNGDSNKQSNNNKNNTSSSGWGWDNSRPNKNANHNNTSVKNKGHSRNNNTSPPSRQHQGINDQRNGGGNGSKRPGSDAGSNTSSRGSRNWTAKDQALANRLNTQLKSNPSTDQWTALQKEFFNKTGKFVSRDELAYRVAGKNIQNWGEGGLSHKGYEGNGGNSGGGDDDVKW